MIPSHNNRVCAGCGCLRGAFVSQEDCPTCEVLRQERLGAMHLVVWVMTCLAAGLLFILSACSSSGASVVTDSLLDQVAWRESRNNPEARGRAGEIGAYQIRAIAVREVNRVFGTRYTHADAIPHGRDIARLYLLICESRVKNPTADRVYRRYRGLK